MEEERQTKLRFATGMEVHRMAADITAGYAARPDADFEKVETFYNSVLGMLTKQVAASVRGLKIPD
jgi:hypothetical protein